MMRSRFLLVLLVIYCLQTGRGEETFPATATVAEGQDAMFRFELPFDSMIKCSVRSPAPALVTHVLWGAGATVGERIRYWGDNKTTCGARIKNVSSADVGQWILDVSRFIAANETHETRALYKLVAVINVTVSEDLSHDVTSGSSLTLSVGGRGDEYCDMRRPTGESPTQTFTGACQTTLSGTTGADSGRWSALVGVAGKTEEILVEGSVNVYDVVPEVGYSNSLFVTGGINLFCNFSHKNMLHFCRFVRPDGAGFRMDEGIGNGQYSYYGDGLKKGQCGLTIESPQEIDYGTWTCIMNASTGSSGTATLESSILLTNEGERGFESQAEPSTTHTTAQLGSAVVIQCNATAALQYCTILSPEGVEHTGMSELLRLGACALTLTNVTTAHDGTWQCRMGTPRGGFETRALLYVHVTESPLVATSQQVVAILGEKAVLSCHTLPALSNVSLPDAMKRPAIKYCRFIRPDGTGFAVEAGAAASVGRYQYYGAGFERGECGLQISSVGVEDRGTWRCAVKLDTVEDIPVEFSDSVLLSASGSGVVFPSWVYVNQGDDVILQMTPALADQSHCIVRLPDGTEVDLGSQTHPDVSYWGAGVKKDSCGVRINTRLADITAGGYDQWTLISKDGQGNRKEGSSWVVVANASSTRLRQTHTVVAELGGTLDVNCSHGKQDGGAYCIVLPPSSESSHYVPGPCSKHVDPVTLADFGEWTCITGTPDTMVESVENIRVVINELPLSVEWKSIDQSTGEIICKLPQSISIDFCRFVSPDGNGMRVSNGLARDRYSYAGHGTETGECGLRITNISKADYGSWRCYVGFAQDIRIGYVTVPKVKAEEAVERAWAINERAVAVRGSGLTIACRANASLAYCWLRHPNGTTFTPLVADCPPDAVACYQGAGLHMGECGLAVARARNEDSGSWACHMGVVNGGELVATVEAHVSETPLMAKFSEIDVFKGASVTLSCHAVPPGSALDYCRFVRSDGVGFHPDPLSQQSAEGVPYSYSGSGLLAGDCGLFIKRVKDEDDGLWTCAARIKGQNVEARDTLTLSVHVLSSASIGGITVGSILAVSAVVIAIVWSVKRTQQHRISNVSNTSSNESAEDTVLQVIPRPTYGTDTGAGPAIVTSEML